MEDDVKAYQESEKLKQELTSYCKKIKTGLTNPVARSMERAIWELMQNAVDLADNQCEICVKLSKDGIFEFSHNGKVFDYTSLRALVQQSSSKEEDAEKTIGRYGTGFMTTHVFSLLVHITGSYKVCSKTETKGYVNLNFVLNRSSFEDDVKARQEMKAELDRVDELCNQSLSTHIPNPKTTFRYQIDEKKIHECTNALDMAVRLMPIVMVINKQIQSVTIINEPSGKTIKYTLCEDSVTKRMTDDWLLKQYKISNYGAGDIFCRTLESPDIYGEKRDIVVLPPYDKAMCDVHDIPSLFMHFPLLGTEDFGVHMVFHSNRFYPVEKRDAILLPSDNNKSMEKRCESNTAVLERMIHALINLYAIPEHAATLPMDNCRVNFRYNENDECQKAFCKQLQKLLGEAIRSWKIIPTAKGNRCLDDGVCIISPDIFSGLDATLYATYEPIIRYYAQKNAEVILPSENLFRWSSIIREWKVNKPEESYILDLETICKNIQRKDDELIHLLEFVKIIGRIDLYEEKIIPNKKGELKEKSALAYCSFLDERLYQLVCPIIGRESEKLVDQEYAEMCGIKPYTQFDLKTAIQNGISTLRNRFNEKPQDIDKEDIEAVIRYCNCHKDVNNIAKRGVMVDICKDIYGIECDREQRAAWLDEEDEMYESPFNFLCDYTLYYVANYSQDWVCAHVDKWALFLKKYFGEYEEGNTLSYHQTTKLNKLKEHAIFLNQKGTLCRMDALKIKSEEITNPLEDIYEEVFEEEIKKEMKKSLRDQWVDDRLKGVVQMQEHTPKEIADEIEQTLENAWKFSQSENSTLSQKYTAALLNVIEQYCGSEMLSDLFPHIRDKKEVIVFGLKTGIQKKNLFQIMKLDDSSLAGLAKYDASEINVMLADYQKKIDKEKEDDDYFQFCYKIGKRIEKAVRHKIQDAFEVQRREKKDEVLEACDIQNGQDIIIKKGDKEVYYLEIKAKWNFEEAAHMSVNQMRMAVKNKERYALCCVHIPRELKEEIAMGISDEMLDAKWEQVKSCIHVKCDIGSQLEILLGQILLADADESGMRLQIDRYISNMREKYFDQGHSFDYLIEKIIEVLNTKC